MNRDGRPDLIALASGMPELVWYENPGWQRHVISGPLPRMINLAVHDLEGDGVPEIAVASLFENVAKNSVGVVSILRFENGAWTVERDRPSSDVASSALGGPVRHRQESPGQFGSDWTGGRAAGYEGDTALYFYDPKDWKRQEIPTQNRGVTHGIFITDWNGDRRDDVLTAGFLGLHSHQWNKNWKRVEISKGAPDPWPKGGSSDVAVGMLGKKRFLAAIEPWHGNIVSVYDGKRRDVIDTALVDGHTVVTADLDGDGKDEIIAGCRGGPQAVYIYRFDGSKWNRRTLDEGGIAAAACVALDLNGDKRAGYRLHRVGHAEPAMVRKPPSTVN